MFPIFKIDQSKKVDVDEIRGNITDDNLSVELITPRWKNRQGQISTIKKSPLFLSDLTKTENDEIKPQKPSLGHEEKKDSAKNGHEADGILNKKDKVKVDDSELLFFGNTSIRKKKRSLTNFKEGVRSTATEKKSKCCLM
ncbi:Oidioi.mRNA.OKI2018_I69.chr1.g1540.t1.cds [Oikopleura dioica]|uniref:Oidioi.mRNA.OKI2018_I69.chr1.g1540.t1.cds n=1 Tax=Oikopleura dioica TaxID=34765 RepID=A0ABN7SUK2_OIKDI|nr:Oidioi.mRNA.OKI2018_I69.chr1.g1540.t1.cds [Oikopleura dioica]